MFDGIEVKDWITISAIIIGPILAIQIQKLLERTRNKKNRRLTLFYTLMSTRATRLSNEHVTALNLIDIEFYGRKIFSIKYQTPKEKSITNAWKIYNDQLSLPYSPDQFSAWNERGYQLFINLLYKMSNALGYDFDEVQIKRDCYRPAGHGELENDQYRIRKAIIAMFSGAIPIPIKQFENKDPENTTQENTTQEN